eukprot:4458809-Amphidinium_carterae.1
MSQKLYTVAVRSSPSVPRRRSRGRGETKSQQSTTHQWGSPSCVDGFSTLLETLCAWVLEVLCALRCRPIPALSWA